MYFFDKKIVYLIWEMQEGHARGVGTAKLLAMDAVCRIEITITGCGKVQGTYPVYMLSGDMKSLLGEIVLNKGKGSLFIKSNTNALGHLGFPYTKVTGIYIDLMTEGCLMQKWLPMLEDIVTEAKAVNVREPELPKIEPIRESELPEIEPIREPELPKIESVKEQKQSKVDSGEKTRFSRIPEAVKEIVVMHEPEPVKEIEVTREPEPVKPPEKEAFQLYPSKWQQLCAIYPIVHPFNDGRAYLSVEPRDFVVLQERFQPMVQNSFLLHGFYHYKHLLLGRSRQGRSFQYYLGVPGVFYEKEKAAALFYGFESFESAVTPASEGSFGYYMKRVQI